MSPFCLQNSCGLVLQETSHSADSHLWFRVCCCQNRNSNFKKQATVETATYGSEFDAAKTATEQIMDIRQTLRYLGAPITTKSFLFGDNRSVVTSATLPHSTLTKRHNILAFHRVREAIAAKLMAFYWIQSAYNLSDMLSKH